MTCSNTKDGIFMTLRLHLSHLPRVGAALLFSTLFVAGCSSGSGTSGGDGGSDGSGGSTGNTTGGGLPVDLGSASGFAIPIRASAPSGRAG